MWGWNGKAALLFLLHAYYLILFYSNSSAPSVTLPLSLSLALALSVTHRTLALSLFRSVSV